MKILNILAGLALALGLNFPAAAQTVTTLNPTADAYIESGTAATNYGTANILLVRQTNSTTNLSRASYLQFGLTTLPAGTITSAKLRLYGRHETAGAGVPVDIRPSTGTATWGETALNWNNAATLAPVNYSSTPIATTSVTGDAAKYYEWDVTAFIASRRSVGHATLSAYTNILSTYRVSFNSKEGINRPQLVVTVGGTLPPTGTPTLFYLNFNGNVIKVNANGTGRTQIVTGRGVGSDGIAVDVPGNRIYWTNMGQANANDGTIMRSDLNGANVVTVVPSGGTFTPKQLKLDKANGKLYWSDREGMRVMRSNLDGSSIETLVTTGTTAADRADSSKWCVGIALDIPGGKVYWTQKGGNNAEQGPRNRGSIRRANLQIPAGQTSSNRTDIEVLFSGLPEPIDLELDLNSRRIYWTDRGDQTISRAAMSVGATRQILSTGLGEAIGLTLDIPNNQIFFTNVGGRLGITPLNGGAARTLLSNQGILTGIQLVNLP